MLVQRLMALGRQLDAPDRMCSFSNNTLVRIGPSGCRISRVAETWYLLRVIPDLVQGKRLIFPGRGFVAPAMTGITLDGLARP